MMHALRPIDLSLPMGMSVAKYIYGHEHTPCMPPLTTPVPYCTALHCIHQQVAEDTHSELNGQGRLTSNEAQRLFADPDSDTDGSSSSDLEGHNAGGEVKTEPPVPHLQFSSPAGPAALYQSHTGPPAAGSVGVAAPLEGAVLPASVSVRGRHVGRGTGGEGTAPAPAPPVHNRGRR